MIVRNVASGATMSWQMLAITMRESSMSFAPRGELDSTSSSDQSTLDLDSAEATLKILADVFGPHGPSAPNSLPINRDYQVHSVRKLSIAHW